MRIIAGKYKNRVIETPEGVTTRPMLSRVRKSLMDILQPYLDRAYVLDLFSGTGVFAIESLSRGALRTISIDKDGLAIEAAKKNLNKICTEDKFDAIQGDVLELIPRIARQGYRFDIIGITPPYGHNLANQTLKVVDEHPHMLKDDCVVFAQRDREEDLSLEWNVLQHVRTKRYGRTVFEFFMPPEIDSTPEEES